MKIKIDGMTCQHCAKSVIQATTPFAKDTPQVDLEAGTVEFEPVEGFSETDYAEAIDELGYEVVK